MIVELLNRFDPEPDVLLRAISAHVSDEMLECSHLCCVCGMTESHALLQDAGWDEDSASCEFMLCYKTRVRERVAS